jgi:hypothetical protein
MLFYLQFQNILDDSDILENNKMKSSIGNSLI